MVEQLEVTKTYNAKVEEVHSGDDLILMVDLGHDNLFKRVRVRLQGVDTPDAYKADASTEAGKVRDTVRGMTKDRKCIIKVHSNRRGGWIVTLHVNTKDSEFVDLNNHLRSMGFIFSSANAEDKT
jgi:hypothetical protein